MESIKAERERGGIKKWKKRRPIKRKRERRNIEEAQGKVEKKER